MSSHYSDGDGIPDHLDDDDDNDGVPDHLDPDHMSFLMYKPKNIESMSGKYLVNFEKSSGRIYIVPFSQYRPASAARSQHNGHRSG